ncbi:hypothetical protein N0V90_005982 [Kalmusia sp. IMI 367209]|nr:hypothetical protein N0V90_005982 [Kalmusia sp. IMI 367209]
MRAAVLSAFTVLLGLYVPGSLGSTLCHSDHPLDNWSTTKLSFIKDALDGPIALLCKESLNPGYNNEITHEVGDIMFAVSRKNFAQDAIECKTAFASIVSKCISGEEVAGGVFKGADGLLYEIFDFRDEEDGDETHITARAPGRESKARPRPAPKSRPKPAPKPDSKPQSKPKPKPKPEPKPSTKPKPSKISSAATIGPTKTCRQINALMLAKANRIAPAVTRDEGGAGDNEFVGSRLSLERRGGDKSTKGCGVDISALKYPTQKTMMWKYKGAKDSTAGVYDGDDLEDRIKGPMKGRGPNRQRQAKQLDQAKTALLDLKYLMGARSYMRQPVIADIFSKQKNRIGEILDKLDKELPKHRKIARSVEFELWKPQQLKSFWDEYMDERFNLANLRVNHDMDTYLAMLKKEWAVPAGSRDQNLKGFYNLITKVEKQWHQEKRRAWKKPW